jgi:glycosyltransferase involved in cell wall biosynthesis
MIAIGALGNDQVRIIRGSGVNLSDYSVLLEPEGPPVVAMAAQLLRDKGVYKFVEAARLLKPRGVEVMMGLIGASAPGNPTSIAQAELDGWAAEGVVDLVGYRSDIARQYVAANIVCLPSYREGLPKGLVEAASCRSPST